MNSGDAVVNFSIATTSGTITNGASSMGFTTTPSAAAGTTTSSGTAAFTVGGTLTVGESGGEISTSNLTVTMAVFAPSIFATGFSNDALTATTYTTTLSNAGDASVVGAMSVTGNLSVGGSQNGIFISRYVG